MFYNLIKAIFLALFLTSCAAEYDWKKVKDSVYNREWHHVSKSEMYFICTGSTDIVAEEKKYPNLGACAFLYDDPCKIYSKFSEWVAQRIISGDGLTLYEHEHKHCDGYIHQ